VAGRSRVLSGLLAAAAVLAIAWTGIVYLLQRRVLFPAPPAPTVSPAAGRAGVRATWLGPDGVEAWYLPPRGVPHPAPAVLFMHGNGELIDYWLDPLAALPRDGVGVLLVEYPGYGRSGGRPSEASIRVAMVAAFDHLAGQPEVDPDRIVAWGRSLGAAAACSLARERGLAALVLESAFTGVRPFARRFGLFGPLVRDPFECLPVVAAFDGPVLVIHGERDGIVPVEHGRALADAAKSSDLVLLPCGHNDCPDGWPVVRAFLTGRGLRP
jgi:uncharacterized protein